VRPLVRDLLILLAVFAGVTLVADLAGAANLGTAATFGQIAFMAAVVALILLRRE
jgi:hypothetical protein